MQPALRSVETRHPQSSAVCWQRKPATKVVRGFWAGLSTGILANPHLYFASWPGTQNGISLIIKTHVSAKKIKYLLFIIAISHRTKIWTAFANPVGWFDPNSSICSLELHLLCMLYTTSWSCIYYVCSMLHHVQILASCGISLWIYNSSFIPVTVLWVVEHLRFSGSLHWTWLVC